MALALAQAMATFQPSLPLAVAYSGGADSTALLVACAEKWPNEIRAVHVHHGLQAAADDFAAHCEAFCTRIGVPIEVHRVRAHPMPGQSPEEAARTARYEIFRALPHAVCSGVAINSIALAQHADDQVETMLLALSRGAGLPGLAAMPARWSDGDLMFHRPLLAVPGADLREWLKRRGIGWIEDPSNADQRYTRNRIRAQLLPALQAAFPAFRSTFARSAAHAAQGAQLLADLGAEDLTRVGDPPAIGRLRELSAPRLANLLRLWLLKCHKTTPSAAQLNELVAQIGDCKTRGHRIRIKVGRGFVVRHGEVLDWYNPALSDGPQA
ncbi:MAG: tRNA lysidine(34) synthetase TilS [Burkholderiales bacterium]